MTLILAFGVVLLISVSLSGVAARTVLSSALMFLVAGAVLGPGILAWDKIGPNDPLVATLADVALFTVLFTDGQRANLQELRENWSLSGRALGMGMPLTMIGIAVPAHFLAGLNWPTAFLVGAILSPTDPVFAAAIVGRSDIPQRLRRLLNVESGLNDGLALPFVMIFLATAQGAGSELVKVGIELVLGLALGVGVAAGAALAWRTKILTAEPHLQPLGPLAIAVVVYAGCHLMHANPYLAAFAAGSTLATLDHVAAEEFQRFGDLLSEVTKFAALIVFGALLTPEWLSGLSWRAWVFAVIVIAAIRPAAMLLSLVRTRLTRQERLTAAWFGPKGFASVVYGLLALQTGIADRELVFDVVAVTIALSIALHSSTDAPIAKMLRVEPPDELPGCRQQAPTDEKSAAIAR
ncbi:cation:proton antiporter [Mycobacterium kansasii]|uniref:K(+)/H(+) antiporter NhaP n=3 Tax=Mycobacterium kansasii TaxID=1768 RepID=A0A653F7J2_MYCKA|nr:cation:proton antiporter [Mycobacterium kansasii]AGZ52131.1 peptidase [Mycobacterium kansasii ATCC 12478]ARG56178.1 peptidase [Mycobacterium kansasii]ARG61623.1 peptidase [Mycobacterium kansasii]ARG69310.1 peptidase [Mycobacterium kansasii]ARG76065.1 peptidase [Mycobacterium kansasii]